MNRCEICMYEGETAICKACTNLKFFKGTCKACIHNEKELCCLECCGGHDKFTEII